MDKIKKSTHRSVAIATRCNIDAVQHKTSHDVQMSHNSGPNIQPLLICKMKKYSIYKIITANINFFHPIDAHITTGIE